ncbi:polymer-forming cytoskeletal protein [Microbacterium aurum]|uniref:polymer-forming cytoskeletal protein n=1 Tax=Microbacterium aurum TaxID=36805 RepID=UPI001EF4C9B9|nr:polymer-forming cytoskeletal protein [Microbacterium aurum]MCG7414317.1 polymer-forming cytoskeletal protein [Microbacterium aurum]
MLKIRYRDADGETGSAIVTVLIIMLVLTIAGLTLAAITVNTANSVVSSRSTAQSRAAADAGLTAALALAVRDGDICDDVPVESDPVNGDLGDGSTYSVTRDCASLTGRVVFRSEGHASGGAVTTTEAVYDYNPVPLVVNEPALVTRAPLNLSALKIKAVDPDVPSTVWVIPDGTGAGDFTCNSGGAIAGSVYLPAGTVLGVGGCEVTGDVYAEKDVTIGSGTDIHGDLVSLNGKVQVSGGSTIDGGVYAKGDITFTGGPRIYGDVVSSAGSVTLSGGMTIDGSIHAKLNVVATSISSRFVANIYAGNNLTLSGGAPAVRDRILYGGTLNIPTSSTAASWAVTSVTKTSLQPLITTPQLPNAPEWQGITKADLDALVANGVFKKITWSGNCSYSWYPEHEMIAKINSLTTPTLIDASACTTLDMHQYSGTMQIKTDIIFVAPAMNVQQQKYISADGKRHRLWFIVPEEPTRNCATSGGISIATTSMLPTGDTSKISAMIFTQCTVTFPNAGEDWRGSVQAGVMAGKPNYWYTPVGFPGSADPGDDESESGGGGGVLGDLVSRRDVASG